jgi:hypothetical protein
MSPRGRVRRHEAAALARAAKAAKTPAMEERFWSKVERRGEDECWPWKAGVRNKSEGYGAFGLNGRQWVATHVALLLSSLSVPPNAEVCHSCDWPPCCNPRHLFIGTRQINCADKVRKRRHAFGERGFSRLNEVQAKEIKTFAPSLHPRAKSPVKTQLARRFGVTESTISAIWSGQNWKHL